MLPAPGGTASCMNNPRLCTVRTASANVSTPAATSAEYSPRLCPASNAGSSPPFTTCVHVATLCTRMAGWVFCVSRNSSSGPSKHRR